MSEQETCLNCARLLECSLTSETCERYQYAEPDKNAVSSKYIKAVQKLNEAILELKQTELALKVFEKAELDKLTDKENKKK